MTILKDDFRIKYQLEERFRHYNQLNYSALPGSSENHWQTLTGGLFASSLELVELAAQSFSIEPRFPFFDRRLIEFCIALPPGERIYNGWTRAIFRYAMSGILPADVQWRHTKANLSAGIKSNLIHHVQ